MAKLPGMYVDLAFGLKQLLAEFNGKIDITDNLSVRLVEQTAAVAGGVAVTVEHNLGRVPRGVLTAGIEIGAGAVSSVPGIVYYTTADRATWTEEEADLRYSVDWTAHTVILIFF